MLERDRWDQNSTQIKLNTEFRAIELRNHSAYSR